MNKRLKRKNAVTTFDVINIIIMVIVVLITLTPFWFCIVGSLNEGIDYARGGVLFFPRKLTIANYIATFADKSIGTAFLVTTARTIIGTVIHVLFTIMTAYAMSRSELKGKKVYMIIFIITMFFYGGIIPTYLLYKKLGLINKFLVYIIPGMFSVWDMIIFISFLKSIPESIVESARIDGANEYTIFFKFIIPLSKPVIAAISLFVGVGCWNSYFDSMMFTTSSSLQTVQLFLMKIITSANVAAGIGTQAANLIPQQALVVSPETLKLAMMIVTTLPIILLYPFLQKYFIKGMLVGSVKG